MQRARPRQQTRQRPRLAFDNCPAARTLDVVGERWALLIVREALEGATRFEQFRDRLRLSENTLARRLRELVDRDVLERRASPQRPNRFEYRLTERGRDLAGVLAALAAWGQRWVVPDPDLPAPRPRPAWLHRTADEEPTAATSAGTDADGPDEDH